MALTCSLIGHAFDDYEVVREREERGSEVVTSVREVAVCDRCGAERVLSENTEVTSIVDAADVGGEVTESAATTETADERFAPQNDDAADAVDADEETFFEEGGEVLGDDSADETDEALVDEELADEHLYEDSDDEFVDEAADDEWVDENSSHDDSFEADPYEEDSVDDTDEATDDEVTDDGAELVENDADADLGGLDATTDDIDNPTADETPPADTDHAAEVADDEPNDDDAIILTDAPEQRDYGEWPSHDDQQYRPWDPDTLLDRPDEEEDDGPTVAEMMGTNGRQDDDDADDGPEFEETAAVADGQTILRCPNCSFQSRAQAVSLRKGDACPECHAGYLVAEGTPDAERNP